MSIPTQRTSPENDPRVVMYDVHLDAVYKHLWHQCGADKELTEDLTVSTFVAAVGRFDACDGDQLEWLLAIADEVAIAHFMAVKP